MKLNKKIGLFSLVSVFLLSVVMAFIFTGVGATNSDTKTVLLNSEKIASTYFVGEQFTIPDSVDVSVEGETVSAVDAVIRFPDGTVKEKGTYTLVDKGSYSVIYSFVYGGQKYKAEQSFSVGEYQYGFNNDALTASYGDLTMSKTGEKGLTISLSEGEEFIFKAPFNVNDSDWANICRLYPIPVAEEHVDSCVTHGNKECTRSIDCVKYFVIKVIDCYDSNNYIELLLNNNLKAYNDTACGAYYVMARAANQDWVGLRSYSNPPETKIQYDGNNYNRDTISGLDFPHASYGAASWSSPNLRTLAEQGGINFSYNEQAKQVIFNSSKKSANTVAIVNDFDSSEIHGDNLFCGFTTGEVYVSISCSVYRKNVPQQIEIASLLGVEGEDLKNLLKEDKTAPLIKSKIGLNDGDSMYVAKNELFSAPEVSIYDLNFKDLNIYCYTNYGTDSQSLVYMNDGKFTPTQNGKYTLVYSATDYYGNNSIFSIDLYSVDQKSLEFDKINVNDILIKNAVCELPVVVVSGLNGNVETKIYVTDPIGEKFLVNDYKFNIEYSGKYELEYVFSDGIYSTSTKVEFTNDSQEVLFLDDIALNKYYIKSVKYSIDDYYAYLYSEDGLKAVLCDVYVSADNGEFVLLSNNERYEYLITANETLQFKYKYRESELLSTVAKVVDVAYGANIDYTKYFSTPFEITENSTNYNFSTNSDGKIEFINPISVPEFLLEFEFDENNKNFSILNIYLDDYYSDNSVKISFKKDANDKLLFALNDGMFVSAGSYQTVDGKYMFVQTDFFASYKVFYQNGKILTNMGSDVVFDLNNFESEIAYLTFEFVGVQGNTSILLKKIGNQTFRENIKEAASTFITEEKSRLFNLEDRYVIDIPKVNNILFPVLKNNIYVTVIDDNGDIVADINGTMLDNAVMSSEYIIEFKTPGIYVINYSAIVNGSKNTISTTSKPIALNVADNIKPEVKFNGGINENSVIKSEVGKTHKIRSYTVSDNSSLPSDLTVRIAIYNDRYALVDYGEFNSYVFKKAGKYTVKVICFDSYGNQASATYTVVAK